MSESSNLEGNRPGRIDLADLALAYDNRDTEATYFLDREAGQVTAIGPDARFQLEQVYEAVGDASDSAAFDAALQDRDLADWLEDEVRRADQIEAGVGERYLQIPSEEPSDAYDDLVAFIDTITGDSITDRHLRARLERAIVGRGAFRRFKDELSDHPAERERWFGFREARLRERVLDWLRSEGIAVR